MTLFFCFVSAWLGFACGLYLALWRESLRRDGVGDADEYKVGGSD